MTLTLAPTQTVDAPDLGSIEPDDGPPSRVERIVTALIVGIPFVALVLGVVFFWGRGVGLRDLVLAVVLYFVVGHGMTIGFHRMLAHKSFRAPRPVRLVLVALGSMAFEGGPIGWVADHRRHHVFSDTARDPHSPRRPGHALGGLFHAHVGWLFTHRRTSWQRHAADLLADRDMVVMNNLFPMWCTVSLGVPFGIGWLFGGPGGALTALIWAGLVRVCVLHHATWSVNSLCHTFGRRPFATKDHSTNLAVLAVVSFGESWHNGHHAFPRSARHGLLTSQWDSSARVISIMERVGWATDVHRPDQDALRRRSAAALCRQTG